MIYLDSLNEGVLEETCIGTNSPRYRYILGIVDGYHLWHCIGYPAFENDLGHISWYVNDVYHGQVREYCKACNFDDETTVYWLLKYGEKLPRYKKDL